MVVEVFWNKTDSSLCSVLFRELRHQMAQDIGSKTGGICLSLQAVWILLPKCSPPVGRHTKVLEPDAGRGPSPAENMNPYQVEAERERMNESERLSRASARRPSVVESPEFKKAKLGADSESATLGAITPGEPIFGTLEDSPDDDVEIPLSRTSDLRMSSPPRHPDPLEKTLELV